MAGPGNATANVLNGASAASAIQQYNQAFGKVLEKGLPRAAGLLAGKASEEVIEGFVEDAETAINSYGDEIFNPINRGISQGIDQIGNLLGLAITTSVANQNVESVISPSAQMQMPMSYIFSSPVLSGLSVLSGTGTTVPAGTRTDETGATVSPSWSDNVLMAKKVEGGEIGTGSSSGEGVSLGTGGAGSGGLEPDDDDNKPDNGEKNQGSENKKLTSNEIGKWVKGNCLNHSGKYMMM